MRRFLILGALLMAAGLVPVLVCGLGSQGILPEVVTNFGGDYLQMQAGDWRECVGRESIGHAALLFFGGMLCLGVGVIFRDVARQRAREHEDMERRVEGLGRQVHLTPAMTEVARRAEQGASAEEIEVSEPLDFGAPPPEVMMAEEGAQESVMAFVQGEQGRKHRQELEQAERERVRESARQHEFYVPSGLELAPVVYVDAAFEAAPGQASDGSRERPFRTIQEGTRRAFQQVLAEKKEVVVRVCPGVYQEAVELPDRVVLVNDCTPGIESIDERLAWLRAQTLPDHPERVTLLAPGEAPCALRVRAGQTQGIVGCYLVGREGVAQRGMEIAGSRALAVVNCAFEGFSRGAVKVSDAGDDIPGRDVYFSGCIWKGNASVRRGGALRIARSVVRVVASIFDSNRAGRGGAIWAEDLSRPLVVERCMMQRNRALGAVGGPEDREATQGWGGALAIDGGLARVTDTILEGNDARGAGGAIAVMGARLILRCTGEGRGLMYENRAQLGGGLVAIGRDGKAALVKISGVSVVNNLATDHGGGLAVVGRAVLKMEGGECSQNRAGAGHGGGVLVRGGGQAKLDGVVVSANLATGSGGGIAAINGSLKVMLGCGIFKNRAGENGGGVLAITAPDLELARRVTEPGYELPFRVVIEDVNITHNVSGARGGGLCLGNEVDEASFPLVLDVRRPQAAVDNQAAQAAAEQLWVRWAGQVEAQDGKMGRLKLRLK
ncbi:hypothetical protein DL240_07325 [Lujinxingia litoralis]|uniref:Right handed beta helix domain-containing protein n=2 Tax=Lujinxingia litoralis TaxID=2211119 RepID=A0A328CD83_9DELT|nr:hypothetical protein DL240_07325 [Lujinxingia litoralis]